MAALLVLLALTLAYWTPSGPASVAGMQGARNGERVPPATPIAGAGAQADPLDGDPLAGDSPVADPLDGNVREDGRNAADPDAPEDQTMFVIERSGRPKDATRSDVAYDGNPKTVWSPGLGMDEAWLWLDVGTGRRLKAVRWFAKGAGTIEVAISIDRQRWETLESVDIDLGWGGILLREEARYVRLSLLADDEGVSPEIAEVAVYGRDIDASVTKSQDSKSGDKRKRGRDRRSASKVESAQDAGEATSSGSDKRGNEGKSSGVRISAKKGETHCKGDRARCQAREGKVSVEEDCASTGSCTIDVRADGGSATCDATGGKKNRAGDGEGRRAGDGGECEAVADGGAVTIGDINP